MQPSVKLIQRTVMDTNIYFQSHETWNTDGWRLITDFDTTSSSFNFTMANMIDYFIHRRATDGKPCNDFKDLNSRAFPLFKAGHIQYVQYLEVSGDDYDGTSALVLMKCTCIPEMKKDITYTIHIAFNSSSDIVYAVCGCTAGHGPKCTCKHLASLCYFVEEFCRMTGAVNYSSATSSLQKWHQPRKRSLTPYTLNNIKFTKSIFGKNNKRVISTNYDPRPDHLRSTSIQEVCQLRTEIEIKIPGIAMLYVLPASESTNNTTSTTLTTTSTGTEHFTDLTELTTFETNPALLPRPVPRTNSTRKYDRNY